MSQRPQPDDNSESPEVIKALFQKLAEDDSVPREGPIIWGILVNDRWFRAEVRRRARQFVISSDLQQDLCEDIAQQVLIILAAQLEVDPSMHANAALLPDAFLAWIRTILDHACKEAARLLGELRRPHAALCDVIDIAGDYSVLDRASDCSAAVAKLRGTQRSVMLLFLKGRNRREIADTLHMSYKRVIGAINRAVPKLKRSLAAYREARA